MNKISKEEIYEIVDSKTDTRKTMMTNYDIINRVNRDSLIRKFPYNILERELPEHNLYNQIEVKKSIINIHNASNKNYQFIKTGGSEGNVMVFLF